MHYLVPMAARTRRGAGKETMTTMTTLTTATLAASGVLAGPFAVFDRDGNALCHSPGQNRSAANSARKRRLREDFARACEDAGLVTANHRILTISGKSYPRGAGRDTRDAMADMGHIIADDRGGAYCLCNLVPQEGRENRSTDQGMPAIAADWPIDRWASAVRTILIERMTGPKRQRVAPVA